ncbi:acyltransferase [uncultured Maricaulis sp.]|uniref:acyltransferase family protein n=1 Tax=uncultured Maricaulis sp. TaxID=174710 RepID=UPI0030DBC820|tara:strand:- start:42744 stop:43838 length:1095 start_codon:yes stop_codon:yes gene_type:complete
MRAIFHSGHGRLEDKSNTFTAMRIVFAIVVVYAHAVLIPMGLPYHGVWPEFVDATVQLALDGFFILSGYMITASLLNNRDMLSFTASRVLRIFPGLIAAVLLMWLVVGPLFTELSPGEYWSHAQTLQFPLMVISQADPLAGLPEVFNASPIGGTMNGALWTIRYELLAYLGVGLLAAVGLYRHRSLILVWAGLAAAFGVAYQIFGYSGIGEGTIGSMARFGPAFMIGAGFYAARDQIPLSAGYVGLALLAAFASQGTAMGPVMLQIALAWLYLWVGFLDVPGRIGKALREVEDVSYGVYILHWPLGMMAFALMPGIGANALFAIMTVSAIAAGWVLRVTVEKPALAMKPYLLARLRQPRMVAAE